MEFIDKSDIMKGIGPDTTADLLEKAMGHKYYKREGTPGNYKYYYTEAEYKKEKGKKPEDQSSEVIEKDGKKYKLQPNGKYLEISEQGMTKKEHERDRDYFSKRAASEERINNKTSEENVRKHHTAASKLSDKEFTKEELEDKGKKTEAKQSSPKSFDAIRQWAGDHLKDEYIQSIVDALDEAGITNSDLRTKKVSNREADNREVDKKVMELRGEIREGLEHEDMRNSDIKDVLWGMVMASRDEHKFFD